MFVLRVSSSEMSILEDLLDYYLSDFSDSRVLDLKHKVICSEFYDDDYFDIVFKDSVLFNDVSN